MGYKFVCEPDDQIKAPPRINRGMDIPIDIIDDYSRPVPSPEPERDDEDGPTCAKRCLQRSLTQLTFSFAFFSGLSLTMAGLFREQIGSEELDANRIQYKSKKIGIIGLLIVAYSFIGICVSCTREVHGKYKMLCAINMMLSFGTLMHSTLTSETSLELQGIDARGDDIVT